MRANSTFVLLRHTIPVLCMLCALSMSASSQAMPAASAEEDSQMLGRILAAMTDRNGGSLEEAKSKSERAYRDLRKKSYAPKTAWTGINEYGLVLMQLGELPKAVEILAEAKVAGRDLSPQAVAESTFHRAFALDRLGKSGEAIQEYEAARALAPDNGSILLELGSAYRRVKEFDKAHAAYNDALKITPNSASLHGNVGNLWLTEEKFEEAASAFEKAAAYSKENGWAAKNFLNLAWQYQQKRAYDKALGACQRALELAPDYPLAHADTALALAGLGRKSEARVEFEKALALRPDANTKRYIEEGMKRLR
jgi:tetratricopeptide (TPR) repeat protein